MPYLAPSLRSFLQWTGLPRPAAQTEAGSGAAAVVRLMGLLPEALVLLTLGAPIATQRLKGFPQRWNFHGRSSPRVSAAAMTPGMSSDSLSWLASLKAPLPRWLQLAARFAHREECENENGGSTCTAGHERFRKVRRAGDAACLRAVISRAVPIGTAQCDCPLRAWAARKRG